MRVEVWIVFAASTQAVDSVAQRGGGFIHSVDVMLLLLLLPK